MNVYILYADVNRYQSLVPVGDEDWEWFIRFFNGTPIGTSWSSVHVEVFRDDNTKSLLPSDFPALADNVPVFSQHAVDVLDDLLQESGEILPLSCADGAYFAFNVTCLTDALNLESSKLERFKGSNRIMDIIRYEFYPEKLEGLSIFKLVQLPEMYVFVTDKFVKRVRKSELTGFEFRESPRSLSDAISL